MAAENPEIIILSSDEESKPQAKIQFSEKQKKSRHSTSQVKSVPQIQSRYSSKVQAVNIMKQPVVSKSGTRIIAVPVHKNHIIVDNKIIRHNVHNSFPSKTYYSSKQLQNAKLVKPVPQKNFCISKSVVNTQNFNNRNNVAMKISSEPVVRTSTPKPTNQKQPVLKFGSNLSIISKSSEVRSQNPNKTAVSPSVISALEKKGISVTNVYEDNISNIHIPKKKASSHNVDVVTKINNSSSNTNSALKYNKSSEISIQGLKRKYSNLDTVGPCSASSAKRVANNSNHNLFNPSSSQYIKEIASLAKDLSINPVKNIPFKNGSQIKGDQNTVTHLNLPKKASNVVHHNSQHSNLKNNCFVSKTSMKYPNNAPSISSLQQATSNKKVSIFPTKSSHSNPAKENLDKKPPNSEVNQKRSVINLEATDLRNSLAKNIDRDLIVCYSSSPSNRTLNPSKKSVPNSSITKIPASKVLDSKMQFKQTTLNNSVKQSLKTDCKKLDLSKDRSALLNLLALCDSNSSKETTSLKKTMKNNLNAAVTIIPITDKPLSTYKPGNNVIESMKLHEIKEKIQNWPKLVVSLEKLNLGPEYTNKNISTKPIIKTLDSNKLTLKKGKLSKEINHPESSYSQLSSNATNSLISSNCKSMHHSVPKDISTKVKGLKNPLILENSEQSYKSTTVSLNKPDDKYSSKVLSPGLTIETINLSESNCQPTNKKSQLTKEKKSPNTDNSQLSTNIMIKQVKCSNIKTLPQAVDNSDLVIVQNKKLENIFFESTDQNKNLDTNSLKMHIDKETNKLLSTKPIKTIYVSGSADKKNLLNKELRVTNEVETNLKVDQLSTNVVNKQVECSNIQNLPLQPIDIDLAKDKHLLNSIVFESILQSKKSDTKALNTQVEADVNENTSMKPKIETVYLSNSACESTEKKNHLSKEQKSLKEIQMNSKCHTDLNNSPLFSHLTNNQVESSHLKSKQQAFDISDSSKIKETDFQISHQSNDCSKDLNKHEDTCVTKKLSNQLIVETSNLSDSDHKFDNEKVQISEELKSSARVTNCLTECSNANPTQQTIHDIVLQNTEETPDFLDSDKLVNKVQISEELEPSNEITLFANIVHNTEECSNINPIQPAFNNVVALPNTVEVSDINKQNFIISENSQSSLCVGDILGKREVRSDLKYNKNLMAHSSSKDDSSKIVNSSIAPVISPYYSSFSLNKDIKMTLIDQPHNLSHTEILSRSDDDYDLLDKSASNITKGLNKRKNDEFSEAGKQPTLVSFLNPDVPHIGDSYNSVSIIIKNLMRSIISNVEELNKENNSIRSNILKVTGDSNSIGPKYVTNTNMIKNSVKSKSKEITDEKESRISNIISHPVNSKCFVVDDTLKKESNTTKPHYNGDLLLCPLTSKKQDSKNKSFINKGCKKSRCSNIDYDSPLNITSGAFSPCTETMEKLCNEELCNSEDDECNIKIVSVMSASSLNVTSYVKHLPVFTTPGSNVTNDINDISVVSTQSSGVTNDNLNYELGETNSTTIDNDKNMICDYKTKRELSDQFKKNMSEFENKMGSTKHSLDFQNGSNISSPLYAVEGLSCTIVNVESKCDTVTENEQNFDFPEKSEFREKLYKDDDDYESMDSDDQVTATGLKPLSSEESTSNIIAPSVTDDEKETQNHINSKQVTSPKLSLKKNKNIESPNEDAGRKHSVKRMKLLDSSLSSDVIQEQNSNFSSISYITDEKNKKKFMELLEFSKTLMEETSQTEKEKIVKNMLKKLNETQLWYAGSEKFSTLIDHTHNRLNDQNSSENVFSVLQDVRKEFKKYKCKFKPTVVKGNNTDTNSEGSFLSIKINAVESNTDSSSMTDMHFKSKKKPSLTEEASHSSNLKNGINGVALNSVSLSSHIDSLPAKCSELSSNNHKIENDLQSISFCSALQETLKNLDCSAKKAILDPKSTSVAPCSQNLKSEEKAPFLLQEFSLSKSSVPNVYEERTSVHNLCASPSFQSHSPVLDSSKPCFSSDTKENKLCLSSSSSSFEPLPSCSYDNNSNNNSSLENLSSEKTSNRKPDGEEDTSLNISSFIPVNEINDTQQQRRINKLEKQLEKLDKKIKKLQEKELSLDDLDDENSSYILEEKYVKRFKQVWEILCKLKKQPSRTGRIIEKKFKYEGTRFEEINKAIENMINKKKAHEKFPDFVEVLTLIKNVNETHDIGLNERSISVEAERVFKDIGIELQRRRMRDHEELFGCHLTDGIDLKNDPAEHNEELKNLLNANSLKFEESINKVLDSYAEKQKNMPMGEDKQNDKNSSDNEEDVEEVKEVDKEDLPFTDPGSGK